MKKNFKFVFSILMLVAIMFGMSFFEKKQVFAQEDSATTTSSAGISISNANDLLKFFEGSENGYLTNDIDLAGKFWIPKNLNGKILNGNGFSILNMTINESITGDVGFLSDFSNGKIVNIQFKDSYISSIGDYVGVVAGKMSGNAEALGINIENAKLSTALYAGGMVGKYNGGRIENCRVSNLNIEGDGGTLVGMYQASSSNIRNSFALNCKLAEQSDLKKFCGSGSFSATSCFVLNGESFDKESKKSTVWTDKNENEFKTFLGEDNFYNSWVYNDELSYPVLRGVGNTIFAIKKANDNVALGEDFGMEDFSKELNSENETIKIIDNNTNAIRYVLNLKEQDITWKEYAIYRLIPVGVYYETIKGNVSNSNFVEQVELKNQFYNNYQGGQNYFVLQFSQTPRYQETMISAYTYPNLQKFEKIGLTIMVYIDEGAAYVGNCSNADKRITSHKLYNGTGAKLENKTWYYYTSFDTQSSEGFFRYIYLTKGTKIYFSVEFPSELDFYHSMRVANVVNNDLNVLSEQTYKKQGYIVGENHDSSVKDLRLCFTDFYPVVLNSKQNSNFINPIIEWDGESISELSSKIISKRFAEVDMVSETNLKLGGNGYTTASYGYVSYSTGEYYSGRNNGYFVPNVTGQFTTSNYPVYSAQGFEFSGFRGFFDEDNLIDSLNGEILSSTAEYYFSTTTSQSGGSMPNLSNKAKIMLSNFLTKEQADEKLSGYRTYDTERTNDNAVMLFATWRKKVNNTLTFKNTLYNGDSSNDDWMTNFDKNPDYSLPLLNRLGVFTISYTNLKGYLYGQEPSSSCVISNIPTMVPNDNQINMSLQQIGAGLEFKGIVISAKDNNKYAWTDNFYSATYLKSQNPTSFDCTIYNICGDVVVYAVFERTATFDLVLDVSKESTSGCGFNFSYGVFDYNGNFVASSYELGSGNSGTISSETEMNTRKFSSPLRLKNLKAGYEVRILNMSPIKPGYAFSKDGELRFNTIKSSVIGEYQDPKISYNQLDNSWSFLNLENASIKKEGNNISYNEVYAYVDMKEVAVDIEVVLGFEQNLNLHPISDREDYSQNSSNYPKLFMQKEAVASSVLSKIDNTKYLISSMSSLDSYLINVSNQNYFKLIGSNVFVLYKYDEKNEKWVFESNNNIDKFLVYKNGDNYSFNISESLGTGKYRLYILLEEQEYKFKFSNFENGSVKYVLGDKDATNIPDEDFINDVKSGGEIKLSYVDVCALYLSPNSGYYIKTLLINGIRFINEGVLNNGNMAYGEGYKLNLSFLDTGIFNNIQTAPIEVEFAPRTDSKYVVNMIKEDLNGDYNPINSESVEVVASVGEIIKLEDLMDVFNDRYFGFEINMLKSDKRLEIVFGEDNNFNIYFQRINYTIIYISENQELKRDLVKYGHEFTLLEEFAAQKEGHSFSGNWTTDYGTLFSAGETLTVNMGLLSEFDEQVEFKLYAVWSPKQYTIIWDGNGSSNSFDQWGNYNSTFYKVENIDGNNCLTSKVVYGEKLIGSNKPLKPSKAGYEFAGWAYDDNTEIDFSQSYNYPRDMKVKAIWKESVIGIQFDSQYAFIDLSYSLKMVMADGRVGDLDALGENDGLPTVNCQDFGLNFVGFYTSTNAGTRILENTLIKDLLDYVDENGKIVLYAHYTVAIPNLRTDFEKHEVHGYTGEEIKFFNIVSSDFSNNQAGFISYTFKWTRANSSDIISELGYLNLKNVSDSGTYTCSIVANHNVWGQSIETNFEFNADITPLEIDFELENTKKFDMTSTVLGVKGNQYFDVLTGSLAPTFDSVYAGSRNIVANFKYSSANVLSLEDIKKNFVPKVNGINLDEYETGLKSNYYTFSQDEQNNIILTLNIDGEIQKAEFEIIVNGKGYYNSKPHVVPLNEFLTQDFKTFLDKFGLAMVGNVKTISSEIKTYFASNKELEVEFEIIDHNKGLDLTSNFVCLLGGQYEILNGDELRTLYIEKLGSTNTEDISNSEIFTPKFDLIWVLEDGTIINISSSGEYSYIDAFVQVVNDNNSNYIQIVVNNSFNGEIKIVANSFIYNIGSKNTTVALLEWQREGKGLDVSGDKTLTYTFTDKKNDDIQAIFRNYAIINYDFILGGIKEVKKVYNTGENITLLDLPNDFEGLKLLGWFKDKNYTNEFTGEHFRSIDEINLYAKYELLNLNLDINLNEKEFEDNFSKVYDGRTEKLWLNVTNSCDYINYSIEIIKSGKNLKNIAGSSLELDLKNVAESGEYRFIVTARVMSLNLSITNELSRSIEILKNNYTITQNFNKTYDGDAKLKHNGSDYVVISVKPSETVTEDFKIVGNYNSYKIDANLISISSISPLDDARLENYNFIIDITGTITPKDLTINIGDYSQNIKEFDDSLFEKEFNNDVATGLLENDNLYLNVSSQESKVGQYSFEDSSLDYTLNISNQLGEEVSDCYDITFYGGMEIGKVIFSTRDLSLNDVEVVYDAQMHVSMLNGQLPSGISVRYYFQKDGAAREEIIFDNGTLKFAPVDVGTYNIYASILSDGNYSIVGETEFTSTLTIAKRKITLSFGELQFETIGIKTLLIDSREGEFNISNLPLVNSHYLKGTISTNDEGVGKYFSESLIKDLNVYNEKDVDVSENYEIVCNGSIEIVHYYIVSFDKNSADAEGKMQEMQINYGATVNLYSNTYKRNGYSFVEWNTKSDGSGQAYKNLQPVTNLSLIHNDKVVLYAIWTPARSKLTVEYYTQDYEQDTYTKVKSDEYSDDEIKTSYYAVYKSESREIVIYNSSNFIESNLVKSIFDKTEFTGFVFDGSQNESFVTEISFSGGTLKIYFKRLSYTFKFVPNNNQSTFMQTYQFGHNFKLTNTVPDSPIFEGYQFEGWYLNYLSQDRKKIDWNTFEIDDELVSKFISTDNDGNIIVDQNGNQVIILWANYLVSSNTPFSVEIYKEELDGTYSLTKTDDYTTETGNYVEFNLNENKLYVFDGVLIRDQEGKIEYDYDRNEFKTFALTNYPGFSPVQENGNHSGFVFANEKLVLKIYYARNLYKVTFDYDNGIDEIKTYSKKYGQELQSPSIPSKQGYRFVGWFENENLTTFPIIVYKDLNYVAKWEPATSDFTLVVFLQTLDLDFEKHEFKLSSTTNHVGKVGIDDTNECAKFYIDFFNEMEKINSYGPYEFKGFEITDTPTNILECKVYADGSGRVEIYLNRKQYSLSYNLNGGEGDFNTQTYKFEQEVPQPNSPSKQDYVFAGWYLDETFQNMVSWPFVMVEDTTIYARWNNSTDTPWKIEFYKENLDGSFAQPIVENFTGTTGHFVIIEKLNDWSISLYEDSSKATFVQTLKTLNFEGYNLDETLGSLSGIVESDLTLKVYLKLNEYNFVVHYNNSDGVKTLKYKYTQPVGHEEDPHYQGYTFIGWFLDEELTLPFNFDGYIMPSTDVEIFAKFIPALVDFKINYYIFKYNNETDSIEVVPTLERTTINQAFTNNFLIIEDGTLKVYDSSAKENLINTFELESLVGYRFDESKDNVLEGEVLANGLSELSLYFVPKSFEVILNLNGGTIEGEHKKEFVFGQSLYLKQPSRLGYDFVGWFYDIELSNQVLGSQQPGGIDVIFGASNFEIFAGWRARLDTTYRVEYYLQNINDNHFILEETKIYKGQTGSLAVADLISRVGFTVDENLEDEEGNRLQILSGQILGDNSTVLKVYYTRNTYTITFVSNGGGGEPKTQAFKFEQTLKLEENTFAREGFEFIGWSENENDSQTLLGDRQEYTFYKASNLTFFAMWSLKAPKAVAVTSSVASNSIYYGDTINLTAFIENQNVDIEYIWFKDGIEVSRNNQIILQEIDESGEYYCTVNITTSEKMGVISNKASKRSDSINVTIQKRPVKVEFKQEDFVYDGTYKTISYSLQFEFDDMLLPTRSDVQLPNCKIEFSSGGETISYDQVKKVATYLALVTTTDSNFELVNNEYGFEILPCPFDITSQIIKGGYYKYFGGTEPLLSSSFVTPIGEEIEVSFERESGENVGFYDLTNPITEDINYRIILNRENDGFEIKKIGSSILRLSLNQDLLTKIYDGKKISLDIPAFELSNIQTSLPATITEIAFAINKNNKEVGRYEIALRSCSTTEFENVELDKTYYFTITPKTLTLKQNQTFEKVYDQTTDFDVLADGIISGDLVAIKANTQSSDVATNLNVVVKLVGLDAKNYSLDSTFDEVVASILPRNVKVVTQDKQIIYGDIDDLFIDYQILGEQNGVFETSVDQSQFEGALSIQRASKYVVGKYEIELGTLVCLTSNYIIAEVETAYISVVEREIGVQANFNKIYDGTADFNGDYSFENAIEGDDISLLARYDSSMVGDRTLSLALQGSDATNYLLTTTTAVGTIEYEMVIANLNYGFENLQTDDHSQISISALNLIRNKTIRESGYSSLPQPYASGWEFEGWYTSPDGGEKWEVNTLINYDNCPSNSVQLFAHWSQGSVKVNVGVITLSSSDYVIEPMDKTNIVSGYFSIDSQSYYDIGNEKEIRVGETCVIEAVVNSGYEFIGFYNSMAQDALALESNAEFTISGNTITILMNKNISIYLRFKLQQKRLTLDVNTDDKTNLNGEFVNWEIEKNTTGNLKSFSLNTDIDSHINLPNSNNLTRQGYTLLGWAEDKDDTILYTGDFIVSSDNTLYAIWSSNAYVATFVASTGDEDTSLLNSDLGKFENPTDINFPGNLEVPMQYGQLFGNIQTPVRKGFEFDGWYDNPQFQGEAYNQDSKYEYTENKTFYAKWTQKRVTIKISYSTNRGQVSVRKALGIDVNSQTLNDISILTINMDSLAPLRFDLICGEGYDVNYGFDKLENIDFVLNRNLNSIEISRLVEELNIFVNFTSKLHEILIKPSQNDLATINVALQNVLDDKLRAEVRDDENIVTKLSNGDILLKLFTEEKIMVLCEVSLGYFLQDVVLQGTDIGIIEIQNNNFGFYGFNRDCSLLVNFAPMENEIIIKAGYDNTRSELNLNLGTFKVVLTDQDGKQTTYENSNEQRILAKTGSSLTLIISPNDGFVISNENWKSEPYGLGSDWTFDFSRLDQNIVVITGFNSGGELLIPFERVLKSLSVKVALYDNDAFEVLDSYDGISYEIIPSFVQNNQFYFGEQISLFYSIFTNAYQFVGWSDGDLSSIVATSNFDFVIEDDETIYLIVEYSTYVITYLSEGGGEVLPNVVEVKHGKNSDKVLAIAQPGYSFEKWQRLDGDVWVDDTDLPERSEENVTADMTFRAIFLPNDITINVSSKLILYYNNNSQPVFEENDITSLVGTIYNSNKNQNIINAKTGDGINLSAYAKTGYHIVGWEFSTDSEVSMVQSPDLYNILVENFTHDFTLTAIFETDECNFEIYFANRDDYSSKVAGIIYVDPEAYLTSSNNNSKVFARARVGQSFEINAKLEMGYEFLLDGANVLVGFKAEGEDMIFVAGVQQSDLQGLFKKQINLNFENFEKGGSIYIFVDLTKYQVTFYKTAEESKQFELTINSTFSNVDSNYLLPTRVGYNFKGWYSDIDGNGLEYVNERGVVQTTWNVEHENLYAHWERAYVKYNISYSPGMQALNGNLDWIQDTTSVLHYAVMNTVIEYYVGNDVYFEAPESVEDYKFSHFELNGTKVCSSRRYDFYIPEDETNFEQNIKIVYGVKTSVSNAIGGSANIDGESYVYLTEGETAILNATPNYGYEFVGWIDNIHQGIISNQNNFEVSYSSQPIHYTPVFQGVKVEIVISTVENGKISSWKINSKDPILENGKYYARYLDSLSFEVESAPGYWLSNWTINGNYSSTFERYVVSLNDVDNGRIIFTPVFNLATMNYTVTFNQNEGVVKKDGVKISSGVTFSTNYLQSIVFEISANTRYRLSSIKLNGVLIEGDLEQGRITILAKDFDINIRSVISIEFEKLYWLELMEEFEGDGTMNNPYLIYSAKQFAMMCYLINNNIDAPQGKQNYATGYYVLSSTVNFDERFWIPIGTEENPFGGTMKFDYRFTNIHLDKDYAVTHYDGLFGYITEDAQFIDNLGGYKIAIIAVGSFVGLLVIITVVYIIYKHVKKKKLEERQNTLNLK